MAGISYTLPGGRGTTTDYYRSAYYLNKQAPKKQTQQLINQSSAIEQQAIAKNTARENEIRSIYTNILNSISGSENSLRASGLADIEKGASNLRGQSLSNLISTGLAGTTATTGVENNVSQFKQSSRIKLEDLISTRKREAQLGYAGFIERIQNPYPDYNSLQQALIAGNQ